MTFTNCFRTEPYAPPSSECFRMTKTTHLAHFKVHPLLYNWLGFGVVLTNFLLPPLKIKEVFVLEGYTTHTLD